MGIVPYSSILNIHLVLSCLNFKRMANYARMYGSFLFSRITGKSHIWHTPTFLSVEPANYCNLKCPECPVGNRNINKKAAQLNLDIYQKIMDEIASNLHVINLYFQGEPLFAQHFCEMVNYAKQHNLYTITSTNAQLLTNQLAKDIVESGLDKIIVSIDGITQASYEKYRQNGNLQKAIDGIRFLDFWKKQLHRNTPIIEIQCLRLKSNEQDWRALKKTYRTWGGNMLRFKTAQFYNYENGNILMPEEKYSRYARQKDGKYRIKYKLYNHCLRLWNGAVIDANANVLPCCFDKYAEYKFGNAAHTHFITCWHSKEATAFRNKVLTQRSGINICTNCNSH